MTLNSIYALIVDMSSTHHQNSHTILGRGSSFIINILSDESWDMVDLELHI